MKSLSAKTFQCGVTVQGLTTLSGTVYLTALTNTATWDYVVVGTTAQGQLYTRTYAQLMSDITSGIGLSGYVPTSRTLTINGVSYDLTANRSWTISTVDYTSRLQHQVKAGVAINKGQAVYVTSADGTNMIVGLASNASEATSSKTMGLLDATVSTNGFANVVTEGLLAGLNTSAATAGDPVWLGVNGNLIFGLANKPYAPANLVFIGIVTRVNVNNGEIFVKVQNGFELNELHDVDLITTAPINGHLLGYNGTLWVNKTIAGWLGYTPANASGTTNYISKFTGATTLGNSLVFDNGTNVGIGTASPSAKLHVSTTGNTDGLVQLLNGDSSYGATTRYSRGGNYNWDIGVGASASNNIPFSYFGIADGGITPRLVIAHSTGNVGIGTSSPTGRLEVFTSSDNQLRLDASGTYSAMYLTQNQAVKGAVWMNHGSLGMFVGTTVSNGYLAFGSDGSYERMRITSPGNVVINSTSTPYIDDKLYIASGNIILDNNRGYLQYTTGGARATLLALNSSNNLSVGQSNANNASLLLYGGTGNVTVNAGAIEVARFTTAGNVGIGITNPYGRLEIQQSSTYDGLYISNSTSARNAFGIWHTGGVGHIETTYLGGGGAYTPISIDTSGTSRIYIETGGNVGIGTTSPSHKLHLYGASDQLIKIENTGTYLMYAGLISNEGYIGSTNATPLGFYTNNVNRIYITTAGNVGIGTTSPEAKLHIVSGSGQAGFLSRGTSGDTWFPYSNGQNYVRGVTNFDLGSVYFTGGNIGIGTTTPPRKLSVIGDSEWTEWQYWGSASSTYTFALGRTTAVQYTGVGEAFVILRESGGYSTAFLIDNDTGNIGIGTTSPSTKLDVIGTGVFGTLTSSRGSYSNGLSLQNNTGEATSLFLWQSGVASAHIGSPANSTSLHIVNSYNTGLITDPNSIVLTNTGNVGIGVTSPAYKLHVKSDTDVVQVIEGTTDVTYTQYYNLSSGTGGSGNGLTIGLNGTSALVWYREAGDLLLGTNNTERVRILAGGNVGIGTSSPGAKLHVAGGEIRVDTGQAIMLDVSNTMYLVGASNQLRLYNGGNPVVNITTGGNVGIGTTSPTEKLQVAGNIRLGVGGANDKLDILHGAGAGDYGAIRFYASVTEINTIHSFPNAWQGGTVYTTSANALNFSNNATFGVWYQPDVVFPVGGNAYFKNNVGIGTTSPSTKLEVNGVITATGGNSTNWNTAYSWGNHSSAGYVPQARTLTINGTSYDLSANRSWTIATTTPGGSNTQFQYNSSGTLAGASALTYDSGTNRVGINQASPGYDLDVNGQVRVQDKLRVGTVNSGNGVVHMSSTATINASATTIVWAQNVSVGMCAFIEYYILNNNSLTDQRAGTIIVTWNQSGTPTITHTETTTPDIGSTTAINFTSSLVGSDARINAVNSSANPYTMVMSYKYF